MRNSSDLGLDTSMLRVRVIEYQKLFRETPLQAFYPGGALDEGSELPEDKYGRLGKQVCPRFVCRVGEDGNQILMRLNANSEHPPTHPQHGCHVSKLILMRRLVSTSLLIELRKQNLADALRFAILWHYGGMYMDTDIIVIKNPAGLPEVGHYTKKGPLC
jgi:hypothetical protein